MTDELNCTPKMNFTKNHNDIIDTLQEYCLEKGPIRYDVLLDQGRLIGLFKKGRGIVKEYSKRPGSSIIPIYINDISTTDLMKTADEKKLAEIGDFIFNNHDTFNGIQQGGVGWVEVFCLFVSTNPQLLRKDSFLQGFQNKIEEFKDSILTKYAGKVHQSEIIMNDMDVVIEKLEDIMRAKRPRHSYNLRPRK